MKKIANQTYRHQNVVLDDTAYEGCILEGCTLLYSGGTFNLKDNGLVQCRLVMNGSAANTMDLLQRLYRSPETRVVAQAFLDEIVRP